MPTPTYTALANITLGSSASSVTFSSIPATYRDLVLVVNGNVTSNAIAIVRFNSDSGTNYPQVYMWGTSSAQSGTNATSGHAITSTNIASSGSGFSGLVSVMDYATTDKHKTVLSRSGYGIPTTGLIVESSATRWANTAAITSLAVVTNANQFTAGSRFDLYGIVS
jgi:hypothetical protein